jgi:hypothetical protein
MVKRGGGSVHPSCMSNPQSTSCAKPPSNAAVVAENERIQKALSGNTIKQLNIHTVDAVKKILLNLELKYLGESTIDNETQTHKDAIDNIIEKLPDTVIIGKKTRITVSKTKLKEEIDILAEAYKYRNEFMDMVNKDPKITEQIKKSILTELNKTYEIIKLAVFNNQRITKSKLDSYLNTDDTVIQHINVPNKYTEKEWRKAIIRIVKYCEAFRISHENDVRKLLKYIRDIFFPQGTEELIRVGGNNIKKLLKKVDLTRVPKIYLIKKNDYKKQNIRVLESPMYATIKLLKNKETQGIRVDDAFVKWLEKKSSSATTA